MAKPPWQSQLTFKAEIATFATKWLARNDKLKSMLDFLLILLVGWTAILVTITLAISGLVRNDYRYHVAAAILAGNP